MSLWDRFENVVKSEWNSRFQDPFEAFKEGGAKKKEANEGESSSRQSPQAPSARKQTQASMPPSSHRRVKSPEAAYRLLEIEKGASLDEVKAAYQNLAKRYHPETFNSSKEKAMAAQNLLNTLTEAFEVLEAQLLPLDAA